jgi:hypothetical protein
MSEPQFRGAKNCKTFFLGEIQTFKADCCVFLDEWQVAVAIVISWFVFKNPISASNAFGCIITLVGCTFYGYVRHRLSQNPSKKAESVESLPLLPVVNDEKLDRL